MIAGLFDAFVFDKFKATNTFFFVFVFLKCAAIGSADTHQNALNLPERFEKIKMVVNGSKSGEKPLLPFFYKMR